MIIKKTTAPLSLFIKNVEKCFTPDPSFEKRELDLHVGSITLGIWDRSIDSRY